MCPNYDKDEKLPKVVYKAKLPSNHNYEHRISIVNLMYNVVLYDDTVNNGKERVKVNVVVTSHVV